MPRLTTPEALIERYAAGVAFVVEEAPAAEIGGFISQLATAVDLLAEAGITLIDEAGPAAVTYLTDAQQGESPEQKVLLKKAAEHLALVGDAVDEYRDMV